MSSDDAGRPPQNENPPRARNPEGHADLNGDPSPAIPCMDSDTTRPIVAPPAQELVSAEACIVQIYGGDIGKRYPLTGTVTIGRVDTNSIVLDLNNVSRHHARLFKKDDSCYVVDLGSTNGTYINDTEVRGATALSNGDLIKVGAAIFKFISGGNVEGLYYEEIYRLIIIDGLTQIHNRRYFMDFLDREMARCSRYNRPLSLAVMDVDRFKELNDTFGHLAGDHILKSIAQLVQHYVRREQLFARFGGDEFTLVLPETPLFEAEIFGRKITRLIAETVFEFDDNEIRTSISMGLAAMDESMSPLEFIQAADKRLYEAKRGEDDVAADRAGSESTDSTAG